MQNSASSSAKVGAKAALRVLLVGQPGTEAGKLEGVLRARGLQVRRARTARDGVSISQAFAPDMLIVHWTALDITGPKFLRMLLDEKLPHAPYIAANAAPFDLGGGEEDEALSSGADIVLPGSLRSGHLDAVLRVALRARKRDFIKHEHLRRVVARLGELQERFDSIDSDLLEAKKLQQGLMRERSISQGDVQISAILRSSGHVGGDLVGHFAVNAQSYGFYALDVSGHGVSSALMTARLAGYLSASNPRQNIALEADGPEAWKPRCPAAAVTDLNELVMEDLETDHYFTLLLGHVDCETGAVIMAQAGHPHPALVKQDGRVEFVGEGGLPVGLIPGADYETLELTLKPGERLLLLSDGFTESTLADGSFLGDAGLVSLIDASRSLRGSAMLEALVWDLSQALAEADDFDDDLSGILVEFGTPCDVNEDQPSPKA